MGQPPSASMVLFGTVRFASEARVDPLHIVGGDMKSNRKSLNEGREHARHRAEWDGDASSHTVPPAVSNETIPIDIPDRIDIILGYVAPFGDAMVDADDDLRQVAHLKLLVPFRTNNGRRVSHRNLEKRIIERAGGFHAHNVRGVWRNPDTGKVKEERLRAYDITLGNDARLGEIRMLEAYVKAAFEQTAVYLTLTPTFATGF